MDYKPFEQTSCNIAYECNNKNHLQNILNPDYHQLQSSVYFRKLSSKSMKKVFELFSNHSPTQRNFKIKVKADGQIQHSQKLNDQGHQVKPLQTEIYFDIKFTSAEVHCKVQSKSRLLQEH